MNHNPDENYEAIVEAVKKIYELEKELALLKVQLGIVKRDNEYVSNGISRVLWLLGGGLITAVTAWLVSGGMEK